MLEQQNGLHQPARVPKQKTKEQMASLFSILLLWPEGVRYVLAVE